MKRRRELLYDVFGVRRLGTGNETARGPRTRDSVREIRISYELGAVLLVLVVVLAGTSFYLGTLREGSAVEPAQLSTRGREGRELRAPSGAGAPAPAQAEPFWAIQALTAKWTVESGPKAAEEYVLRVCSFLEQKEFRDVLPARDRSARHIVVYVGRSEDPTHLEPVLARLKGLAFGQGKPFAKAYIDKIDFPIH